MLETKEKGYRKMERDFVQIQNAEDNHSGETLSQQELRRFKSFFLYGRDKWIQVGFAAACIIIAVNICGGGLGLIHPPQYLLYSCYGFLILFAVSLFSMEIRLDGCLKSGNIVVEKIGVDSLGISGFHRVSSGGTISVDYPWKSLQRAYETKTTFYLFFSSHQAMLLSKDEMRQNEIEKTCGILRNGMKERFEVR